MGPGSRQSPRPGRQLLLVVFRLILLQQRILQRAEDERQRHDAEQFEADPKVGGLRAPDDLVHHGEKNKKYRPAPSELAPAFFRQIEHRIEHDTEQRLAEGEAANSAPANSA